MHFASIALVFAASVCAQDPNSRAKDSNGHVIPFYSPVRAPALPLAVRSPYTNAWISTAHNGTINSNGAIFWNGAGLGWEGIITVDGISYEYFGTGMSELPVLKNLKKAVPISVSYDSQYSNFTLAAGPVHVTARFLSPVLPTDYCRTSVPLSYFEASWESSDGVAHDVQLYSDIDASWISYESGKTVDWVLYKDLNPINGTGNKTMGSGTFYNWIVYQQNPYKFSEYNDFPQWGNLSYGTTPGTSQNFSFQSGHSTDVRYNYVIDRTLNNLVDAQFRSRGDRNPIFAFSHDFGSTTSGSTLYTVGTIQDPIMRYLTSGGVIPVRPLWAGCYGSMLSMINQHYLDYTTVQTLASQFDTQLKDDVASYYAENAAIIYSNSTPKPAPPYANATMNIYTNGTDQFGSPYIFDSSNAYGFLNPENSSGIAVPDVSEAESYYSIVALSARQVMGAYVLTINPNNSGDTTDPLMFQKEISSDGNVNTVDVMYPAMPFFLYANPELLRFNLNPLLQNQEGGFYPNGYSMHDLGSSFPNATGHVEGNDEYMPVEESGNMILMAYAYYKFTGNAGWIQQHYNLLKQFAQYLIQFSLVPGIQLSTDDFAGRLINQTNLAIKGIVALQAMSGAADAAGISADAQNFSATASRYFRQWEEFAVDPSERHTLLSYQWRSSYGLLYNIYPDKLLGLGIIPEHIYTMQSDWYPTVSQIFGIPLDSRHTYTKSDWELWTAATCAPATRRLFVNAVAYWLNNTSTDRAFTDLYETVGSGSYPVSPDSIHFIARPVAGGHFSLLALLKAGQNADTGIGLNNTLPSNTTVSLSRTVSYSTTIAATSSAA
ncbi:DUF1793-domain-containing protein [Glonium stellatum]|uniref:DUF1793-domain-containing protein n=1 Tax=Glonium stellatum TaxID=574774 RepID=A0A8E2ERI0_9PEZI|nr:DUF1793-domain-containing protein [Glonium stellatum]